jgi:hypothetical protein
MDRHWRTLGIGSEAGGRIDLNKIAFMSPALQWIAPMFSAIPFARMDAQQGFFTVAGSNNADHETLLRSWPDWKGRPSRSSKPTSPTRGTLKKIVVAASAKRELVSILRGMNVHAMSIEFPGADHVGRDLKHRLIAATTQIRDHGSLNAAGEVLDDPLRLITLTKLAQARQMAARLFDPRFPTVPHAS